MPALALALCVSLTPASSQSLFLAAILTGCASASKPAGTVLPMALAPPARRKVSGPHRVEPERAVEIGRSAEGRPINMFRFGERPHPVLVIGGIHGSEANSAQCALLYLSYVRAHRVEFADLALAVIPEANPDGLVRGVRFNARRVDLNRNFPASNWSRTYASGRAAGSEPESGAIAGAVKELQPCRILSIHSIMGEPCNNYDGPAQALARAMAAGNGYAVKGDIGYPTPGSLGSWAGRDLGIPVVTLELPFAQAAPAAWEKNRSAMSRFSQPP